MNNIISVDQFERIRMETWFTHAQLLENEEWKLFPSTEEDYFVESNDIMCKQVLATLFFEPSTRTRLSFETAFLRLGGKVISVENAFDNSSNKKGETYLDTIKTISQYANVIVFRHSETNSAIKAAEVSDCPLVNAGDGTGEHPSQAVIDLYTIWKEKKSIDGLKIAIIGDLKHARTIRSLKKILSFYDVSISEYEVLDKSSNIEKIDVSDADVVYMTRVQSERREPLSEKDTMFTDEHKIIYKLNLSNIKEDAIILHPLPRGKELPVEIDTDPRACYWKQVENGVIIRQALFLHVFGVA